jgi:single-strand DNA-binding protein
MICKLEVIGHIGKDAEVKEIAGGSKVVNFNVASTEHWKDKEGNKKDKTTWVRCALWKGEKLAQYLKKGQLVYVSGTPSASAYNNERGEPVGTLELQVRDIKLLGKNTASEKPAESGQERTKFQGDNTGNPFEEGNPFDDNNIGGDDLPF